MTIVYKTWDQAKTDIVSLLEAAQRGSQVTVITKQGKPVARIVPDSTKKFNLDEHRKAIERLRKVLTEDDYRQMQATRDSFEVRTDW